MAKKLFIGSLAWATNDESLKKHFETIGPVESAKVVMERERPDRSRGFGFVVYQNDDDALKAVEQLNGNDLDGRNIIVTEARPDAARG